MTVAAASLLRHQHQQRVVGALAILLHDWMPALTMRASQLVAGVKGSSFYALKGMQCGGQRRSGAVTTSLSRSRQGCTSGTDSAVPSVLLIPRSAPSHQPTMRRVRYRGRVARSGCCRAYSNTGRLVRLERPWPYDHSSSQVRPILWRLPLLSGGPATHGRSRCSANAGLPVRR